ncbi:PHP domain-containing protein [Rhodohalobacter sp. 8-1]|uniref:PHP domain-containing protein n=1 Tax=Rhodohalobacter sp. 8-1 TaxID=3131972 RepID=UPI0030EB3AB9
MGKADLHIHTNASDGDCTPREILEKAIEKGLKTISITDHDTIKGYKKARALDLSNQLELLPGVEMSVKWGDKEVHLLAYCFDPDNEDVNILLLQQSSARRRRMAKIVKALQKQGIDIDMDEVKAEAGFSNIGRPHAASVLINKGVVSSFNEAFIRYLSSEKLDHINAEYCTISEAVQVMKKAGGVLSLAHPGPLYSSGEIEQMIDLGVDGLECIHPSHPYPVQKKFTKLAEKRNLTITGGSDFHRPSKSGYEPYFGIVTLGEQYVESLKRTSTQRKNT